MATSDDLLKFAARYGNKVLQEQVKMKAPLWDTLEHVKMTGAVGIVNPIVAGQASAKFIGDGATRSAGSNNTPVQGTIKPAFVDAPLVLNNGALMVLTGREDSANYLDSQLKSAGATLAQVIGSSLYAPAGQIATLTGVTTQFTAGVAEVTVPSPAGLKEGMAVTLVDVTDGYAFIVRVGAVELAATGLGASVTLINDVPGVADVANNTNAQLAARTFVSGDQLFQRGSRTNEGILAPSAAASLGPVSLSDLAGSAPVYGITQSECDDIGFIGNSFSSVGEASQEAFLLRMKRVAQKSGDMPDLVCVSPIVSAVLGFSALTPATAGGLGTDIVGQSRRAVDGKLDKYGRDIMADSGVQLGGKRVLEDVNLDDTTAYLVNREFTKIALWQDIQAEKQGGDTLLVKQDAFSKVAFFNAAFSTMCTKRSSIAKLSGITVSL